MVKLIFDHTQLDALEILDGVNCLSSDYGFVPAFEGTDGIAVALRNVSGDLLSVEYKENKAVFAFDFTRRNHFFRCLSLFLEKLQAGEKTVSLQEKAWFKHNGPAIDMSQGNSAMTVPAIKKMLRQMAMMGLNQFCLYLEDTFNVPEEPYFGYMRARYSYEELKELDDYGYALGIELIPAIQSLAHFEDVLKWDCYLHLRESVECLVPEQEETYTFLRHLFEAASKPFRTNRINLNMDEAHGLGLGVYLKRNGVVNPAVIVRRHLETVLGIAEEMGLRPMIADDMFYRPFGPKKNPKTVIPQEFVDEMPKGFDILCWDYYMTNPDDIRSIVRRDKRLSDHVVFQGGIWTWVSFSPHWDKTFITTNTALPICKEEGIDDVQATVWGDTGTQCDFRMILLGLQLFAEHGFVEGVPTEEQLRRRFKFCTGGNYDLFMAAQGFDKTPGVPPEALYQRSSVAERTPCNFLLWQQPLFGMFDKHIEGLPLNAHYAELQKKFENIEAGGYQNIFETYRLLAKVLSVKSELGIQIHKAYFAGDEAELSRIADSVLPPLLKDVEALQKQHAKTWMEIFKPIGWEVTDMRYGALRSRLENAMDALHDYLEGRRDRLEELEEKQLPYNGEEDMPRYNNSFARIFSASRIANGIHLSFPKQ